MTANVLMHLVGWIDLDDEGEEGEEGVGAETRVLDAIRRMSCERDVFLSPAESWVGKLHSGAGAC